MILKFIGFMTFGLAVFLYILAVNSPHDLIFYLVTGNAVIAFGRLIAAGLLLVLIFGYPDFVMKYRKYIGGLAMAFIIFGIIGIMTNVGIYNLYNLFKPLDFMMFIQAGIALALIAAERPDITAKEVQYEDPVMIKPKKVLPAARLKTPSMPVSKLKWE